MLIEYIDNYIKQQNYNTSCLLGINFWLSLFWHDEDYCKSIMYAAYSDYISANPYC